MTLPSCSPDRSVHRLRDAPFTRCRDISPRPPARAHIQRQYAARPFAFRTSPLLLPQCAAPALFNNCRLPTAYRGLTPLAVFSTTLCVPEWYANSSITHYSPGRFGLVQPASVRSTVYFFQGLTLVFSPFDRSSYAFTAALFNCLE